MVEINTGSGYLENHFPENRNGVKDREKPSNSWIHSEKCILQLQKGVHSIINILFSSVLGVSNNHHFVVLSSLILT